VSAGLKGLVVRERALEASTPKALLLLLLLFLFLLLFRRWGCLP